jgi:hypothetical protein
MPVVTGPTIQAGTAISNVVPITNATPYFLITPAQWTPANITFLVSAEGNNFYPMYKGGKLWELGIPPGAAILLEEANWPKGIYMQLVSGSVTNPINQAATRTFAMITGVGAV